MKKLVLSIFVLLTVAVHAQIDKYIKPKPTKLVNDFANILTPEQEAHLEQKLVAYDDSTSNQIAVVLIPTLAGGSLRDASLRILREWGVGGQEKQDNGVVILVAVDDHKMSIEVGYGLEGRITDLTASSILDNIMRPRFREDSEGNYYRGLDVGTNAIMKAAAGAYKAPANYSKKDDFPGMKKIFKGLLVIIVIIIILSRNRPRRGGMVSRRGWWLGPTMMGSGWGSSGGGGGWSGGGGFGGFGGGSGGGGGASGSW